MANYAVEKKGKGKSQGEEEFCCFFCRAVKEGNTELTFKQMTGSER